MLNQFVTQGALDACERFGIKEAAGEGMLGGLLGKAKAFGAGQMGAAKDLFYNLRGGLGGAMNPAFKGQSGMVADAAGKMHDFTPLAQQSHRTMALQNLRTLAPSLIAGGGLYLMHRHKQQQLAQQRAQQQAMMQGGYPPM